MIAPWPAAAASHFEESMSPNTALPTFHIEAETPIAQMRPLAALPVTLHSPAL